MAEPLTRPQIAAAVARSAEAVRRAAPDSRAVVALPLAPEQAAATAQADGWCDVGVIVEVPGGRSYVVRWHPATQRSRLGLGPADR